MRKQSSALLVLVFFLLFSPSIIAQEKPASDKSTAAKGVKPVGVTLAVAQPGATARVAPTRAVIIGISDYQDEKIPDLRFADRDAEAFAQWLRSPAGGSLPDTSITLLLNKDATTGKIITTLDWLIGASKPGDVAIIYFSGHGDVERMTKFQRGYWLTWDSPPAAYAAGAFSLIFLQDIITTLSELGVQVIVVSDACRAGKLAGSEFGGAQATAASLAKQYANEIKILSCQPEEFSLEGEQWGGGRGCFSYHLVDALYGMADNNADGVVNLLEVGRYLEEKVPAETAPHQQVPLTVGNRMTSLTRVNAEALALWQQQKRNNQVTFTKTESKAQEYLMLATADSSIQELYAAFTAAIEQGRLMPTDSTAGESANDYYERLIKEPSIASLHGVMTRNFVAALIDEGQQILNRFLKGDLKAWDDLVQRNKPHDLADKFNRAVDLLGENHYFLPILKAKALYFESFTVYSLPISYDSARVLDIKLMREAVALDPVSPQVWLSLAITSSEDSLDFYIEKLYELTPNWPCWFHAIGGRYRISNPEKSIQFYKKSIELDSTYLGSLFSIVRPLNKVGRHDEATHYFETALQVFIRKLEKDTTLANTEWIDLIMTLSNMQQFWQVEKVLKLLDKAPASTDIQIQAGIFWYFSKHFEKAEETFQKVVKLDGSRFWRYNQVGWFYRVHSELDKAEKYLEAAIGLNTKNTLAHLNLAWVFLERKQEEKLQKIFDEAIALDPTNTQVNYFIALFYIYRNDLEKANVQLEKLIGLDSNYIHFQKAINEAHAGKQEVAARFFEKSTSLFPDFDNMKYLYCRLKIEMGDEEGALDLLEEALSIGGRTYNFMNNDPKLEPIRNTPRYKELMLQYFPEKFKG